MPSSRAASRSLPICKIASSALIKLCNKIWLMAPIQQKIIEAIKKVGDAGGYTYVMEATMMLYSGPSAVDITAQVKKQLGI